MSPGVARRRASRLLSTSLTTGEGDAASAEVVGGEGAWFILAGGRRVIDGSNTAAPLGHGHPEIVEAVREAAGAPSLNEGWRWAKREEAAEELLRVAFGDEDWVGGVRFFISASEANDVALALCQALTGRSALATRERAYHGGSGLAREMTRQPHWHGGLSSPAGVAPAPRLVEVHELPAPAGARITGQVDPTAGDDWLAAAERGLAESAAVLLDYSQGGIYWNASYQDRVAELARRSGALWIADETVTGFGRVGGWFQFQHSGTRPDIVTMGKSLAAGGAPAGAVVLSAELMERMAGSSWQSYSTFRGHPVEVAAVLAHVRASERERVYERATELDGVMAERLTGIAARHASVARIDGRGLHWTIELHGPDWRSWRGEEADPIASRVAARAFEEGALIATSGEQTSLFLAPPLVISEQDLSELLDVLDTALSVADEAFERGSAR